jgi:hypothetical protein
VFCWFGDDWIFTGILVFEHPSVTLHYTREHSGTVQGRRNLCVDTNFAISIR